MKTITENSNFGRFATQISCEIGDEVNPETVALARKGLLSELFRMGGSAGEKALIALGDGVKNAEGKYTAYPKDTKRADIPYSAFRASALAIAIQTAFDEAREKALKSDDETPIPEVVIDITGEHEYGDGASSRKMAEALVVQMRAEKDDGKRVARFMALGVNENDEDSVVVEAAHAFLASLRSKPTKKSK